MSSLLLTSPESRTRLDGQADAAPPGRPFVVLVDVPQDRADLGTMLDATVLDLTNSAMTFTAPEGCDRLDADRWFDAEGIRRGFLEFLDRWPRKSLGGERSFDVEFRHVTGDSIWWTGPGVERHAAKGVFVRFKQLSILNGALRDERPTEASVFTTDAAMARAVASLCGSLGIACRFLPGSHRPSDPLRGRTAWLLRSLRTLATLPFKRLFRAAAARIVLPAVPRPAGPVVIFSARNHDYYRREGDRLTVWFWQELADQLKRLSPGVALRYKVRLPTRFLGTQDCRELYHPAWRLLRRLPDGAPLRDRHPSLGAWVRGVRPQLRALTWYSRLERQPEFRASFVVQGADLSGFFVPRLRHAVSQVADWSMAVEAEQRSLREAGDVRAVVLAEEMYAPAQIELAAARRSGVPTIGVQHGTIMPSHLVYTIPPGQVAGAPLPDRFAVFGDFAREVVTEAGSFPFERVLVTGAPRLDHLVEHPPDRNECRRSLGLPDDRKIIAIAGQTLSWFPAAVRAVFEAARDEHGWLVCVKPHPKGAGFTAVDCERLAREVGLRNIRIFAGGFDRLLGACDVLISASSTTVLEAALLGRPAVCLNFSDEPDWYPYVDDGAALPGRTGEQVRWALKVALSGERDAELARNREKFLRRHAGPATDGQAADRLARSILAIAGLGTIAKHVEAVAARSTSEGATTDA
ncbi:MAG: CDP-glycerol glycerophosphotransferase family protein [Planctomycetaceae bacterium]